jgi:hypothetical protein
MCGGKDQREAPSAKTRTETVLTRGWTLLQIAQSVERNSVGVRRQIVSEP